MAVYQGIPAEDSAAKPKNALTVFMRHGHGAGETAVGTSTAQDASVGSQIEIGRPRRLVVKVTKTQCVKPQFFMTCVHASAALNTHIAPETPQGFRSGRDR